MSPTWDYQINVKKIFKESFLKFGQNVFIVYLKISVIFLFKKVWQPWSRAPLSTQIDGTETLARTQGQQCETRQMSWAADRKIQTNYDWEKNCLNKNALKLI